ncbi:MAG TPA: hypothetical protein DCS15_08825 [Flavobacteriales bacterium]|nr:hypothetical protein [Flavobacteriales bacterium]
MKRPVFKDNFENKSELIRKVFENNPTAKNIEIKDAILKNYGVKCDQNLIIAAIGRYKDRIALQPAFRSLLKTARSFLSEFNDSVEQACWYIKRAADR